MEANEKSESESGYESKRERKKKRKKKGDRERWRWRLREREREIERERERERERGKTGAKRENNKEHIRESQENKARIKTMLRITFCPSKPLSEVLHKSCPRHL
jgi:hypothetical protein